MVVLTANSLSKRHQELNNKVNKTVSNKVDFEAIKAEPEDTDVDRLFKIDLAAKYKNVDYVIETLKSGDSLYISRVLKKAPWLFDEEHSHFINTDNLHLNIFPFMSNKMKKKLLAAVSIHLKNKDRIADFYNYCKQTKMIDLAEKFLLQTSESFKLELINEQADCIFNNFDEKFLKCLLEDSFVLFEAYLEHLRFDNKANDVLTKCSYFYTISDVKYLELLEKYAVFNPYVKIKLGLRISKHVVTKFKDRVLANPKLYVKILNITKLLRHSSVSDVKLYTVSLLPEESCDFWKMNYYSKYKPFIHAIPECERYDFIKKIFTDNYPDEEFEMSIDFYNQKYYELMTATEKEAWALRHIASDKEILGSGNDHTWYKFVSFEKAFVEIKKMMMTATDQLKRSKLLKVLIQSAKTQRELETLLKYYYERHVNERKNNKEAFLTKLITIHNVFQFDDNCWEALNKIFYSIDVYNMAGIHCNPDFKIVSIIYHIVNNKELPDVLKKHIESEISIYSTKSYIEMLNEEKKQQLYTYIIKFYTERVQNFTPGCEDQKCITYIHFTLEFMAIYKKTKKDIPNSIMEFINLDFKNFRYQQILREEKQTAVTDSDLVRLLKVDSKLVIDEIPEVQKQMFERIWEFRMNRLLRKLKIYFSRDKVTQKYLKLFNGLLDTHDYFKVAFMVAYGIFNLSDEKSKIDFMNKFVPAEPKIDHSRIDDDLLLTREAICRFACYSRPPVPLSNILQYLKGDYVKYCLPMFHMYLENLPQPLCLKFVESLLDAPVSVQKHGLRLAFKCFSTENLKNLVLNAWTRTKNVSLRNIIYKSFYEKTVKEQDKEMYETLKKLTLDLHDEDVDDIFSLITSRRFGWHEYNGDFIEVVWLLVEKFKDNEQNVYRKKSVVRLIDEFLPLVNKETVSRIVSDYINVLFATKVKKFFDRDDKLCYLNIEKYDLVGHYLVYYARIEEHRRECIDMVELILGKCLEGWYDVTDETYAYRPIYEEFILNLKKKRFLPHPSGSIEFLSDIESFINASVLFEVVLNTLQAKLPLYDIYIYVWDLKISIITRQVIKECRERCLNKINQEVLEETAVECGKRIGNLVIEFLNNNTYFSYFRSEIAQLIKDSASDVEYYLGLERKVSLHTDHVLVAIVRGLLDTKTVETNLLAVQILPIDPECSLEFYKTVYDTMQNLTDMESKCSLLRKFDGDFKRRRFE